MTCCQNNRFIIFVGVFPPPVHGMALVNRALVERLAATDINVVILNTAPPQDTSFSRFLRWVPMLKAWQRLLISGRRDEQLYIALSGGWGQLYDIISLGIARLKGMSCTIHHHSFAYIQRHRFLSAVLMRIAGKNAMHIVLCHKMERELQQQYGVSKTLVLSNLAFFPPKVYTRTRRKVHTIGFLSNITKEKGGETIIDLALSIKKKGLPFEVAVAGPCHDDDLTKKLQEAELDKALVWRSAVYGDDKAKFWQGIDVFVFPTQYQNEAEPLVIWEALAAGIPVIVYERGCIANQIGEAGKIISSGDDFVEQALPILQEWQTDDRKYQRVAGMAQSPYQLMRERAEEQWKSLLHILETG